MKALQTLGYEAMKQEGLTSIWAVHRMFVVVADADIGEFIWINCLEKDDMMNPIKLFLGNSTFLAPVYMSRPRRRILLPALKISSLNQFASVFVDESRVLVELLRSTVGDTVSIYEYIAKYNMESICQTSFGLKLDIQKGAKHSVIEGIQCATKATAKRVLQPWLQSDLLYSLLPEYKTLLRHKISCYEFAGRIINSKRTGNEDDKGQDYKQNRNLKSVIEYMIEASKEEKWYDDQAMKEEILTMITAGTDTLAVALSYTVLMLARHPRVQDKVYQEIMEVCGDKDRRVETNDLPDLKYTDAVISESVRLYPPLPVLARKTDKDITLPNGVSLPAGCGLLMHVWAMNRNPRYWGADADEFRPERFLAALPHPAQFVTFSFGPRNCIGYTYAMMSMKTVLATLLRRYRILPAPETHPSIPLKTTYEVMMKESSNFSIILKLRIESKI